ncbi:hypothetical protein V6N12_051557 [Hibiscus sabdariffa]|uniref:Uncharacterized protein n=1 Tax=Hibiscus sabdariffa TaxID=183260 RepID=A0ABR2GG75_9ROSI
MIRCKSQKLYFRTSLGLFPISSIDYTSKTLSVSHSTCSSSEQFVSPTLLSAGFPSPPQPNSLLLFNCSQERHPPASFISNCTRLHIYKRVHRRSLSDEDYEGVDLGTRISFDVPDHVPDFCNECKKPNGNCGVGLKCICHAKECKDKVLSAAGSLDVVKAAIGRDRITERKERWQMGFKGFKAKCGEEHAVTRLQKSWEFKPTMRMDYLEPNAGNMTIAKPM